MMGLKLTVAIEAILDEKRYTERSLRHRLAFREFGALMGLGCYGYDDYLQSRKESIIGMWEGRMNDLTTEDLVPITMVMYSAALLPTGMRRLLFCIAAP